MKNQIKTELSPKFTEMKTGGRVSRFGRPQNETKQDANSIPWEILSKTVSKHSPKRSPKIQKVAKEKVELITSAEDQNENLDNNNQEDKKESNENIPMDVNTEKSDISADLDTQLQEKMVEVKQEAEIVLEVIKVVKTEPVTMVKQEAGISETVMTVNQEETAKSDDETEVDVSKNDEEKNKQEFSDSDSALGSASSYHEEKSRREEEFAPGKIMWGSFNKTSWYPCMIYPNKEGKVITGKCSS